MSHREIVGNAVDYRKIQKQEPKQYRNRNVESPDSPDEEPLKAQYHATIKNAPKGSLGAGLASLQKRDLLSNQLIAKQKELNKDKVSPTKLAKRVITQQVATLVHKGPKIIKRKIDNPQEVQVARRYGEGIKPIFEHKDVVVNPEPSTSRAINNPNFTDERFTRRSERNRPLSPPSPSTGSSYSPPPHSSRRRSRSSDSYIRDTRRSPVRRSPSPRVTRSRRPISPRGPRSPSRSPRRTRSPKSPIKTLVRRQPSPSPPKKVPYYAEPKRELDRLKKRARSRSRTRSPVFPSRRRRSRSLSRSRWSRSRSRDRQPPAPVAPQIIVVTQPGFDYSYMDPNWLMHGMRPPFGQPQFGQPQFGQQQMHPNFHPRMPQPGFRPGFHPNARFFGPRPPPFFGPRQRQTRPFFGRPNRQQ